LGKYVKNSNNPLSTIVLVCQLLFFALLNLMIAFGNL